MQRDRAEATLNIMSHEPVILTQTRGRKLQLATIEATPANPPKHFSKHLTVVYHLHWTCLLYSSLSNLTSIQFSIELKRTPPNHQHHSNTLESRSRSV
ncbi:hypothetical protein Bca4012_038900 [Brassica carinata]